MSNLPACSICGDPPTFHDTPDRSVFWYECPCGVRTSTRRESDCDEQTPQEVARADWVYLMNECSDGQQLADALREVERLKEEREKFAYAARQFCGAHMGQKMAGCPECARIGLDRDYREAQQRVRSISAINEEVRAELRAATARAEAAERERDEARADLEVAFCGEDAATYELHIEKLRRLEAERDAAQRSAADARAALEKMLAATDHAIGQSVLDAIMAGGLLRTECPTCKHHGLLHIWSGNAQEQLGAAAKSALAGRGEHP